MASSCTGLAFATFVKCESHYSIISEDDVLGYSTSSRPYQICTFVSQLGITLSGVATTASYLEDGYSIACRGWEQAANLR